MIIQPDSIRNDDTEGSGDAEVHRERPTQPESLASYQSLIRPEPPRMPLPTSPSSPSTAAGRLPQDRADAASLSNVSHASQPSVTSSQGASDRKLSIQNPLLAHRPPEPLPDDYTDKEKDYDYVDMKHASQK